MPALAFSDEIDAAESSILRRRRHGRRSSRGLAVTCSAAVLKDHKIKFDEAATVFTDPFTLTFDDPDHSFEESRFISIGTSKNGRILFVSHVDRGEDQIRIISARGATASEAHVYQESRKPR